MKTLILGVVVILVLAILGTVFYRWWRARTTTASPVPTIVPQQVIPDVSPIPPTISSDGTTTRSMQPVEQANGTASLRYEQQSNAFVGTITLSPEYDGQDLGVWLVRGNEAEYLGTAQRGKTGLFIDVSVPNENVSGGKLMVAPKENGTSFPSRQYFEVSLDQ